MFLIFQAKAPSTVPSSPYPDRAESQKKKSASSGGPDAPIPANYTDAHDVLRDVRKLRSNLEANIDTICRSRNDTDVFNMLNELNKERYGDILLW